jgi:polygalacturonase
MGGTDGINLNGCRNIRVTGCDLNTGDDGVYIASTYKDPREGLWYNCDNPLPIENIEIDNNHCEVAWDETKAFAFIL